MLRLLEILASTLLETIAERREHGRARPSWDFRFEWVVGFLRRDLDARHYPSKALPRVRVSEARLGGVPVVELTPPEPRRSGVAGKGRDLDLSLARSRRQQMMCVGAPACWS